MELVTQPVLRRGRNVGVLFAPMVADDDLELRVMQETEGRVHLLPARTVSPFRGPWELTAEQFLRFDQLLGAWSAAANGIGGYSCELAGPHHAREFYLAPGASKPQEIADRREEKLRREPSSEQAAGGARETFRHVNQRDHIVARVFEWEGARVFWLRMAMVLVREVNPTASLETSLIDAVFWGVTFRTSRVRVMGARSSLTRALESLAAPTAWVAIYPEEVAYLQEVAAVVKT